MGSYGRSPRPLPLLEAGSRLWPSRSCEHDGDDDLYPCPQSRWTGGQEPGRSSVGAIAPCGVFPATRWARSLGTGVRVRLGLSVAAAGFARRPPLRRSQPSKPVFHAVATRQRPCSESFSHLAAVLTVPNEAAAPTMVRGAVSLRPAPGCGPRRLSEFKLWRPAAVLYSALPRSSTRTTGVGGCCGARLLRPFARSVFAGPLTSWADG